MREGKVKKGGHCDDPRTARPEKTPGARPSRDRAHIEPPYPWPKPPARSYTPVEPGGPPTGPSPPPSSTPLSGPLRYTHAAARMREGMRLTGDEVDEVMFLIDLMANPRIPLVSLDIPAARRALDKLRRGLELYEAKGKG